MNRVNNLIYNNLRWYMNGECCGSREEGQANDIPATLVVVYYKRVKYKKTFWYYFLAKTVTKVNFIWLQIFPFGSSVDYNKFWARVSPGTAL